MKIFVIGKDNAWDGALFPIGLLSKSAIKRSWNVIGHDYNPNKENQFRLVKPTQSSWRYPSLLTKNHFIYDLTTVNYLLSEL